MISETLGNIYTKIEDKFYSFFDFLEDKGIPVYKIIDPIEEKGIPFFPLTIALIVILLVALFGFGFVGTAFESKVYLNLKDNRGNTLQGVNILVEDSQGNEMFSGTKNHRDELIIKVQAGAELTFTAEKTGYESSEATLKVINKTHEVNLSLKKILNTIRAKIKFYDEETETAVSGVYIEITGTGIQKNATANKQGLVEFLDIPLEEDLSISAVSDSYHDYSASIRFESDETKSVYLTPKEIALEGESNLIITLFDEEGNLLENAKVKVYDAESNELIDEKIVTDGVYSENFPKGMAVRFTVEKDGFKLYESDEFTLRGEEEDLGAIELEKGGKEVLVKVVYADTGNPVVGAEVTLFNSVNEIVKSNLTLYEGSVLFKGLNTDGNYLVGAEKETYLPVIQAVENETETIQLVKESTTNSKELTVLVVDQEENTIENASLYFTKIEEGEEIPVGIGVKYTDTEGKFKLNLPIGTEVYVKAVKDLLQGKESFVIGEVNNNLLIRVSRKDSVKSIKFFDANGQILGGNLLITTKEGEILYDGEVTSEVLFDAQGKNFVEIELTTPEGKKYSEELNVEGQTDFEINIDEIQSNEKTPEIEFIGIFDVSGNEIEGITKDKEYILKFKTEWSTGLDKGGVHFRTGNDSIKYSDSEDVGITGFDAPTLKYFYGRSFSPTPAPGNEDIDYSNRGQGGKQNKFVEMYFDKPEGTKIIKIRIKASELIEEKTVKVKFRAWSEINGSYYRNPLDEVIGTEKNSAERKKLYAETQEIELKVYDSEPECKQEICVEYNIIDEEGKVYDKKDFFALKGKVYAVEMKLEAKKTTQANFKLNTSNENPRIAFTGSETGSFSQFADNNKSDTLIEFSGVIPREGTKARAYFKAKEAGESFIKSRITTPNDSLSENFYFNVFEEKEMTVNIPEKVMEGKNFEATVKDTKGKGIEDAKIVFFDAKGNTEKTILADEINGKNGVYKIENNLKAGKYLVKITAPKFIPIEKEIQIVFGQGMEIAESITINIPENVLYWKEETGIKNSTEEVIENLSAEIIPAANFPKEFKLNVIAPIALISGEEKQVEFSVEYSGNVNAVLYGEAVVEFTGTIKGTPIKTETKVIVNYNQQLNPDCLEFDRKELKEYLIGSNGNSKQMDLGLKNNCGIPLEFDLEAVPKGNADTEIEFTSGRIRIEKDEVKTIQVSVINKIQRNYVQQTEVEYDLYFKSSQMTKTIPAKIILWHEMFALESSPTIVLWVTQSRKGEPGIARQALFLRNTGMADIQNLSFSTLFDKPGNTEIRILWGNLQQTNIQELKKGMALTPPMVIETQTDTTENQIIIGKIAVTGNIEGRNYTLREINVIINVSSGWSCLEAWGDDLLFSSPNAELGTIDKTLHITNNCVEPVMLKDITPQKIGGNTISLIEYNYTLYPRVSDEFVLRLKKQAETNQKTKIQVNAVGLNTGKVIASMPAEIELAIGKGSGLCGNETTPCKAENETSLEYCDDTGNASFYFPTLSSNCTDGYCDAEELGKFLSEKFEEEIRKAKLRITDVKTIENLGNKCNLMERYCTFGALGVSNTSFDFYLKNDNLTKELLESEIEKLKSAELQNVFVRIGGGEEDLYSSAGSAFGEHLILIPAIKGCGKYSARILGAVAINGNELRQDSTTLLLYIEKGRENTPECENRIQNFMNFLPIDESYTPNNSKNSWLGIIVSNPDVKDLQESFSKTLFKDEKGLRITSNKQNNRITFGKGNFDQTKGIVKISMERAGNPDTPKQLDIYMTNNFFDSSEEVKKDIAAEAGKIISNLKNGKIEKGCISKNMDYLILGSVKNISEIANLQWKDDTKLVNLYPDNYSCAKLKLQSKLEAPEAQVSFRFVNKEVKGISAEETVFRYTDGTEITNKGENGFNLSKAKWKEQGNLYELDFELCFKGTSNARDAVGSKVKLEVEGLKERELKFGLCAISPIEFVERAHTKKDEGKWFATVDWKDSPETLPFQIAQNAYYDKHPEQNPINIRKDELGNRKTANLIGYGLGAFAGSALLTAFTGGGGAIASIATLENVLNAAVPVVFAAFSKEDTVYDATKNAYKKSLEAIGLEEKQLIELKEDTGTTEEELFKNLAYTGAATTTAKQTLNLLMPLNAEAQAAKTAALEVQRIGTSEIEKQFTDLADDITKYNTAKTKLTSLTNPANADYIQEVRFNANGRLVIRGKGVTGTLRTFTEGTGRAGDIVRFNHLKGELVDSIRDLRVSGKPINAEDMLYGITKNKGTLRPTNLVDDIARADGGLIKQAEGLQTLIKGKVGSTTQGKALNDMIDNYVRQVGNDVAGGRIVTPPNTSTQVLDAIKTPKAIDTGKKLEGFIQRNPKKWGLVKGGMRGLGAIAGGWLGTKIAQAWQGDLKEISVPETQKTLAEFGFEKGFTYEVTIKKGHNGEPTYSYKKMDSQELSSIDEKKRLDNDSCEKEPVELGKELLERLKQLEEEENQAS